MSAALSIRQLRVTHVRGWNQWPDTEDASKYPTIHAQDRVERYVGPETRQPIVVQAATHGVYASLEGFIGKGHVTNPGVKTTVPLPDGATNALLMGIHQRMRETQSQILFWDHLRECRINVAPHVRSLCNLAIFNFADDCPGTSEITTFPVAKFFDVGVYYMYLWDVATGTRTAQKYHEHGLQDARFCLSNNTVGTLELLQQARFTIAKKIATYWTPPSGARKAFKPDFAFAGNIHSTRERAALLPALATACQAAGLSTRFYGWGCRDGQLRWDHPLGLGAPVAELYTTTGFSVNTQVSSILNCRLLDLWRTGTIQIIRDPWHELDDLGVSRDAYVTYDGTAVDAVQCMLQLKANPERAVAILHAGVEAADRLKSIYGTDAVFARLYEDYGDQILGGREA